MALSRNARQLLVWAFLAILAIVAAGGVWLYASGSGSGLDAETFYGDWVAVVAAVALFSFFLVAFLFPSRRPDWRKLGITEAYLVALFTEMFGVPLTIYLVSGATGTELGLSGEEGHLWAVLMSRTGALSLSQGVALVMVVSLVLIALGLALMALGWRDVYRAEGLVTTGLYARMRHPQYTGFLLVIVAFLIQWPTILTAAMFPILVFAYVRLARREEEELFKRFGSVYEEYRQRTPMFFPRLT